jgi:nitroimidazol reductase NimA-like FMN-containing flavoprotein (pyridoxamine 5'-phosphate oxidase superfamily)
MLHQTDRTTPHARPHRVSFDRDAAYAILDEAYCCHVGFVADGGPLVIPTTHWRVGDNLYFHGGKKSRLAGILAAGGPIAVTVTLVDGLVLSRSAFHHSMNYRSVVLLGQGREIADPEAKARLFNHLIDKLSPGRAALVRPPAPKELAMTLVAELPISEGSVKARTGPPVEDADDLSIPVWGGVVPLAISRGTPIPDQHCRPDDIAPGGESA